MKTLRRSVAVALLLGSYHVGMAQSNDMPEFKSDAEKQTWINANTDEQLFSSKAEKEAWIQANPEKYQAALDKTRLHAAEVKETRTAREGNQAIEPKTK
jgi:uncharacterized protein (DUF885 family)